MSQPKAAKARLQTKKRRQDDLAPLSGTMAPVSQQLETDIKRVGVE